MYSNSINDIETDTTRMLENLIYVCDVASKLMCVFSCASSWNCFSFCFILFHLIFVDWFHFDIGMIAGYILNRYKSAPVPITPFINVVLWMMSLGVMLLLVFGVWNGTLNLLWTALYVSLGHSGEKTFLEQPQIQF